MRLQPVGKNAGEDNAQNGPSIAAIDLLRGVDGEGVPTVQKLENPIGNQSFSFYVSLEDA